MINAFFVFSCFFTIIKQNSKNARFYECNVQHIYEYYAVLHLLKNHDFKNVFKNEAMILWIIMHQYYDSFV